MLSNFTQYCCGQPIFLSWLWGRKIVVLTSCLGSLFLRNSGEKEVSERVRLNQEFDFQNYHQNFQHKRQRIKCSGCLARSQENQLEGLKGVNKFSVGRILCKSIKFKCFINIFPDTTFYFHNCSNLQSTTHI